MSILYALAIAYFWVKVVKGPVYMALLNVKPINCIPCLTGWLSFALTIPDWYNAIGSIFLGYLVGAIFTMLYNKYL